MILILCPALSPDFLTLCIIYVVEVDDTDPLCDFDEANITTNKLHIDNLFASANCHLECCFSVHLLLTFV